MNRIYLDYAATTPTAPEVVEVMLPYFTDSFGNPSSIYSYGQETRVAIEKARSVVAGLIGARDEEIVFTSGGTESDNAAIKGVAFANAHRGNHIITSAIEHPAVEETCRFLEQHGFEVNRIAVDSHGLVDPDDVKKAITTKTILVSIMHANNEVGTIEPIGEIARIAKEAGICMHSDAVQTAGHIPVNVNELGVDLLSISAHKIYGPKGVGALYIRKGTNVVSFIHGGAQERNWRSGTENVPGIVGFGRAVELAQSEMDEEIKRLAGMRDKFIADLCTRIEHIQLNGHSVKRLPNNINVSIDFIEGESMCLSLDLESICVSTGSACSTSSIEPSHVLTAMGLPPEQAHSSLRFTMGRWTTAEELDRVLDVLTQVVKRLRAISPFLKGSIQENSPIQ